MPDDLRVIFRGVLAEFMADETRLLDLEGGFRAAKTTTALWKVYRSCLEHPGIAWLICRYSDGDTQSKLKPAWRQILSQAGVLPIWDPAAQCDTLPNGSQVYLFGLKAQDEVSRYGKIRGMTLAGIYVDQAEELPHDLFLELIGRLSQIAMPHQLLLTPNPPDENHWLAREFPETNHLKDRRYYSVPIYANAANLPEEAIRGLEQAYPPAHPKHRSAVLGKRGLNVIGQPVYGGDPERGLAPMFNRALHVRRLTMNPQLPLCESIDFGKHHPCVVWAQFTPYGGLHLLGGVMGQNLFLQDFVPLLLRWRAEWFPTPLQVLTCCDPAGSHDNSQGIDQNGVSVLRDFGISPQFVENANAPNIRAAMVERLASYMRRRTPQGEAFGVNDEHWLLVSAETVRPWAFLTDGFEAGYVWDAHWVSVGSKQMRKPRKDGWYEHGQNCTEYLELSFGGAQPSVEQRERHAEHQVQAAVRRAQRDVDPYDVRVGMRRGGRGGY